MNPSELNEKVRLHGLWLNDEKGGQQLDLIGANLRGADLRGANLRGADLSGANLSGADLRGADLSDADLSGANLRGADLRGADLRRANLSGANLSGADLRGADLSDADLRWASWQGVQGLSVIAVQVDTTRRNNQITYIPGLDIVTTGCFQGTLAELKKQVEITHMNNAELLLKYNRVIAFFEEETK